MRLRDLQIGTYSREQPWRLEINKDSCCVSCHYLSKLSRLDTGDVCKAYIKLSDLVPKGGRRAISALGVCEIESKLDFDQYFTLSPPSKKRMLLEHLHGGLLQIAEELKWPKEPFENAYQAVLADNILYSEFWKTPKWNRSRTLRGQVHFCFDIDRLEFNAVAFDKAGKEIARKHLVTYPRAIDSDHYDTLIKYGWKDDRTFFLEGRPTWHHWEVTLP